MFGGPVKPPQIDQVRRAAGRDDVGNESEFAKAIACGADYLVIGRAITSAKDPLEAAKRIVDEIEAG